MDIAVWMNNFCEKAKECFGNNICFIGLQGSYARGEAGPRSDIDAVLILGKIGPKEISAYRVMLDEMPYREYSCGFFCDRKTLENWEKSDLLQLCLDTVPWYGSLDPLLKRMTEDDARRAVRIGACNLYHGCVHGMIHGNSIERVDGLYKGAQFVLRMDYYVKNGAMPRSTGALADVLPPDRRRIIEDRAQLWAGIQPDTLDALSLRLMKVAQEFIAEYGEYEA